MYPWLLVPTIVHTTVDLLPHQRLFKRLPSCGLYHNTTDYSKIHLADYTGSFHAMLLLSWISTLHHICRLQCVCVFAQYSVVYSGICFMFFYVYTTWMHHITARRKNRIIIWNILQHFISDKKSLIKCEFCKYVNIWIQCKYWLVNTQWCLDGIV